MNQSAAYDSIAAYYAAFVEQNITDQRSVLATATQALLATAGDVTGIDVCDLGCGEGHISRWLAQSARTVTGVDLSAELLALARNQVITNNLQFIVDDAQTLATQADAAFDCVISNLALMDIPDLEAVYQSTARVLRAEGRFVFSLTHPCFQTPNSNALVNDDGQYIGRRIGRYTREGFWRSTNPEGIRGQVGAYHRMVSTYLNLAVRQGFVVQQLVEPVQTEQDTNDIHGESQQDIPAVMVIELHKNSRSQQVTL